MNSTHRVNVVKIDEILPHNGADTLGIVYIGGYQVVVKKDDFKIGDLAIYVQPDTIVPATEPFKFLWADREFADGTVPERLRRITVRRFRKEWSEGLLMPLSTFGQVVSATSFRVLCKDSTALPPSATLGQCSGYALVGEGDDVAELLGFKHYEEPETIANIQGKRQLPKRPHSLRGWFFYILAKLHIYRTAVYGTDQTKPPKQFCPVYDVEGFKNYPRTFAEDEVVVVTEKIHGSNARYIFTSDDQKMHVGSHNYWKSEASTCIWRRALKEFPWIEEFCKAHPDYTVYGEVVPTQGGYRYGCTKDQIKFFVFDVLKPDGTFVDKQDLYPMDPLSLGQHLAPLLYHGKFDLPSIKALIDGKAKSRLDESHLMEGIVISSETERIVRGLGRAQLKWKSMAFLEKDGKESGDGAPREEK